MRPTESERPTRTRRQQRSDATDRYPERDATHEIPRQRSPGGLGVVRRKRSVVPLRARAAELTKMYDSDLYMTSIYDMNE